MHMKNKKITDDRFNDLLLSIIFLWSMCLEIPLDSGNMIASYSSQKTTIEI